MSAGDVDDPTPIRSDSTPHPFPTIAAHFLVHAVAAAVALATVVLAGQPIYANDTWIHLALGEAFAAHGPWLANDPHLFAAAGPPSPSSWLGSVGLYGIFALFGFTGLRLAHALGVLGLLVLAWVVMRRAGGSRALASAGVVGFVVLSTYRLVQLRPDLFTIGATLALGLLLFADRRGPDLRRIAAATLLALIWANVHAAFVLGPLLTFGAAGVVGLVSLLPGRLASTGRELERGRALRLGLAGAAMAAGSLLNPQGLAAHAAYFAAGGDTLALEAIADEWNPTNLLAWPVPMLPPTVAAWLLAWLCVGIVVVAALVWLGDRLRATSATATATAKTSAACDVRVDPALLAVAGAGLAAAVTASRFLWLGIFALALVGGLLRRPSRAGTAAAVSAANEANEAVAPNAVPAWTTKAAPFVIALFTLGAAALHFSRGDWPLVSRALRAEGADYAAPYPAERFNTHAIWFLADSGVEGRLFNDYPLGGFMSFWLAPKIRMSSSGTMNVAREAMEANLAVAARQRVRADEDYAALLDRQGFDLFLGAGFPVPATPGRPIPCTVRHLEHEPGWLLVFRNLRSAVYLRRDPRNAANLDRIADYYAGAGVPFDRERGFEAARVLREAPAWSIDHGLVPSDFDPLVAHVREELRERRVDVQTHRLAALYGALGLYARALQIDRAILALAPRDPNAGWRAIWSYAQQGRLDEALAVANKLDGSGPAGRMDGSRSMADTVRALRDASPEVRATLVAHLPLLRADQLDWLRSGVAVSPARSERDLARTTVATP